MMPNLQVSFPEDHPTWTQSDGGPDCGVGPSPKNDHGSGVTFKACKDMCEADSESCTQITWAPGNSHCVHFKSCANPGPNTGWERWLMTSSRSNKSPISSGLPIVYLQQGSQVHHGRSVLQSLPTYDLRCGVREPLRSQCRIPTAIRHAPAIAACAASNVVLSFWLLWSGDCDSSGCDQHSRWPVVGVVSILGDCGHCRRGEVQYTTTCTVCSD